MDPIGSLTTSWTLGPRWLRLPLVRVAYQSDSAPLQASGLSSMLTSAFRVRPRDISCGPRHVGNNPMTVAEHSRAATDQLKSAKMGLDIYFSQCIRFIGKYIGKTPPDTLGFNGLNFERGMNVCRILPTVFCGHDMYPFCG